MFIVDVVQEWASEDCLAVIVGNDAYWAPRQTLTSCVHDAEDMRSTLLSAGYHASNVVTVTDGTLDDLLGSLEALACLLNGAVRRHVMLFYAGRAVVSEGGEIVLVPVDAGYERKFFLN